MVEAQYRVAVRDGLVLSVKYGIAVLLAGIVYGVLAGATWIARDYLAVRQNARNGQQAAIYLVQQQQEQANAQVNAFGGGAEARGQEQAGGGGAEIGGQEQAGDAGAGDEAPEAAQTGADR